MKTALLIPLAKGWQPPIVLPVRKDTTLMSEPLSAVLVLLGLSIANHRDPVKHAQLTLTA